MCETSLQRDQIEATVKVLKVLERIEMMVESRCERLDEEYDFKKELKERLK